MVLMVHTPASWCATYIKPSTVTSSLSCNRPTVLNCRHVGLELAFFCAVAFVPAVKLLLEKNGLKSSQRDKSSLNSLHANYHH